MICKTCGREMTGPSSVGTCTIDLCPECCRWKFGNVVSAQPYTRTARRPGAREAPEYYVRLPESPRHLPEGHADPTRSGFTDRGRTFRRGGREE